jgi:hypothetical protein
LIRSARVMTFRVLMAPARTLRLLSRVIFNRLNEQGRALPRTVARVEDPPRSAEAYPR